MLDALARFGTDRSGQWGDAGIALGRRLARTLPEDIYDEQPVVASRGRYAVVSDVHLSDRNGLIADLELNRDITLRESDAMLVARAIERWQENCFDRLYGAFAIAAWDRKEYRLLLARDPMAQKPLFYHRGQNLIAFASMPAGLHVFPEVPRQPDEDHMEEFLALSSDPYSSRTFYRGIERVVPGHYCVITHNGFRTTRFWNPPTAPLTLGRHEDYVEALRSHLDKAVAAQLRGVKQEVGAHLSAGLDSSAVATTAARLLASTGKRVIAFTAVPHKGYDFGSQSDTIDDEGPLASRTAAMHPNITHVLVRNERFGLEKIDRNYGIYGEPTVNLCNQGWAEAILDNARERRLSVMLVGDLGNAALSDAGMALLPELFARREFVKWWRLAKRVVDRGHMRWRGAVINTIGPWMPGSAWRLSMQLSGREQVKYHLYSPLPAQRWQALHKAATVAILPDMWGRPERDRIAGTFHGLCTTDAAGANKGAQAAWGIEYRDPTADRKLVEFMLRVPGEQILFDGEPKALIKHALADRVPSEILNNTRVGYQSADWHEHLSAMQTRLRDEVELMEDFEPTRRMIDTTRMRHLLANWPKSGWQSEEVIAAYRCAMLRAVSAANFLRRASGSNL